MTTPQIQRVIDQVRAAAAEHRSLTLRGDGSHEALLGRSDGPILEVLDHAGVVTYEPSELYVRVAAGTRLIDLEQTLLERGQTLPFEPPRYSVGATVGGMVASGLAGPARMQVGPLRNFLLGVTVIDGQGDLLRFGGTVIKNVAGYDASRLFAGSFGCLGVLMDVVLRVAPARRHRVTVSFEIRQTEALRLLSEIRQKPWPVDASVYLGAREGRLWLRLQGDRSAIDEALIALAREWPIERESAEGAECFWSEIRDHRHAFFRHPARGEALWRLSLPPKTPPLEEAAVWLIEWHGGLRWTWRSFSGDALVAAASARNGSAARFGFGVRDDLSWPRRATSPVQQRLDETLRRTFDPEGVFKGPGARGGS